MNRLDKQRKKVYRLRPTEILSGAHYKITQQEGAKITLEVVPTDNEEIARRLSKLRYPELYQFIRILIHGLCETLEDELCAAQPAMKTVNGDHKVGIRLTRVIVCLQKTASQLSVLRDLALGEISHHESRVRPITGADET